MEKQGEILNQLAIISDLLDKMNLETESKTIVIEVNKEEFVRLYDIIVEKKRGIREPIKDKFTMTIDNVDIVFVMSNNFSTNNV